MAKSFPSFLLPIAMALCFLSLVSAHPPPMFALGKVYCDFCRVEFFTKLSAYIPGSRVKMECRSRDNGTLSYSVEGVTDEKGVYRLPVEGDHEEDICEVKLLQSGWQNCTEPFASPENPRVLLTSNVGVVQESRFVNPIGFKVAQAVPTCGQLLHDLGFPRLA